MGPHKGTQVCRLYAKSLPVEIVGSCIGAFHDQREVVVDCRLFLIMCHHPSVLLTNVVYMVFPPSHVDFDMKVFGVCITLF